MKTDRNIMPYPGMPGTQPYPGMFPMPGMPGTQPYPGMFPMPGYPGITPNMRELENRVSALERQLRRMEIRLSRIETPYSAQPSTEPIQQPTPMPSTPSYQFPSMQEDFYGSPFYTPLQMM